MRFFFIIYIFLRCNLCFAQYELPSELSFRRLTTAHGLSQDEVHDIEQDAQGFMWFTTISGLCRYDGKNVIPWQIKDMNTLKTMNQGILTTHHIDKNGDFWIGTDHQGIFYYNKSTQKFQRFLNNKEDKPTNFFIYNIINGGDNEILAATSHGLWQYNIKTKKANILFENMEVRNIVNIKNTNNSQSFMLTTANHGIWKYENNQWACIKATLQYKNINDAHNVVTRIAENTNKYQRNPIFISTLWFATETGLYTLDTNNKIKQLLTVKTISILQDSINFIVWIGAENGLRSYKGNEHQHYKHDAAIKTSLSTNHIIKVYADNQQNIWSATYTGGINYFSLNNQPITTIQTADYTMFKLQQDYILTNTSITNIKTRDKIAITTTLPTKNEYTFGCFKDSKNNFWWSLGDNGLQYYNIGTHKSTVFTSNQNDTTQLQNNTVTGIFEDALQNVWVRGFGGVHLYQPLTHNFKHLRHIVKNYDETANSTISHYIDTRGYIWLGKWEGGLDIFDPITKNYRHLSTADGLPSNCIANIQGDSSHTIWLSTLNGIAKIELQDIFKTQKVNIKVYSERDGLPTNSLRRIKYSSATQKEREKLYFQSQDGIAVVYPDNLRENTNPPLANIVNFKVNGENLNTAQPINDLNGVDLVYNQNNINIEMAALAYIQPELNTFKYRLIGLDSTWIENGTNNIAKYTNLSPNKYIFEVIASNNDGIAGKIYRFNINIKPALWQRASFKIVIFLIVVGILLWIIDTQIKRIKKREALARQLSESELAMLRAQMNPHFIFNCMNTIEAYIMMEQPEKAAEYTRKFSRLTRAVLENSEKALIPLETDLDILKIYIELEQIRYRNRFQVIYDIPDTVLDAEPNIPPLLLQPLVENAILHGLQHRTAEGGILKISVAITPDKQLVCSVEDNGIGRKAAAAINQHRNTEKKSLATSITHKRLTLLQEQTKKSTSFMLLDLPQGTRATIQLGLL
jgi:ligand-binding sensor domain-containing protein